MPLGYLGNVVHAVGLEPQKLAWVQGRRPASLAASQHVSLRELHSSLNGDTKGWDRGLGQICLLLSDWLETAGHASVEPVSTLHPQSRVLDSASRPALPLEELDWSSGGYWLLPRSLSLTRDSLKVFGNPFIEEVVYSMPREVCCNQKRATNGSSCFNSSKLFPDTTFLVLSLLVATLGPIISSAPPGLSSLSTSLSRAVGKSLSLRFQYPKAIPEVTSS